MAFKLGSQRQNALNQGQVESKLSFKDTDTSIPGTPVLRKSLEGGVLGEANNDGSIFIHKKIKSGSDMETHVLMHEMIHMTDMKVGKLAYSDEAIRWQGEIFPRKEGKIYFDKQWLPEGSKDFPWEKMPWE